ncbi:MAG: histidine kinase dimerization/phosphoacceptor domain-containing protein [Actinomycetota bacterium]|nr:histidine kinase dimerization/phosphoacceptor domain-containing protein [Actinomycetota bacterium]
MAGEPEITLPQFEAREFPVDRVAIRQAVVVATLGAAGVVPTAITAWAVASSEILYKPGITAVVRALFVASFVGVGMYTWWRRRDSRLGLLVAGVGLFYALTSLNAFRDPLLFTLGRLALAATVVYMAYVFLCFPRDRLGSKPERWFIEALAVGTAILWTATLALTEKLPVGGALADCGSRCPHNPLRLVSAPDAATSALGIVVNATTAIALIGVAILLVRKARSPVRLRRRAVAPLLYAVIALIASYVGFSVLRQSDVGSTSGLWALTGISALAIPATMLFGQIRGRVFAATSLGRIVSKVGGGPVTPTRVQNVIGEALGDPSLTLALWDPAQSAYVDVRGTRVELPTDPLERMVTPVMRDGRPFAALIHDPALDSSSEVVEGVAATSLMLLENTRLVEELRASRARIVKTAQHERLRLERDLHDGAQQRLLAIQLKLSQARSRADDQERPKRVGEPTLAQHSRVDAVREGAQFVDGNRGVLFDLLQQHR